MKKTKEIKKKIKYNKYIKYFITFINLFITIYLLIGFNKLNIIPNKYMLLIGGVMLIINIITIALLYLKKKIFNILAIILSLIIIIGSTLSLTYINDIENFLNSSFNNNNIEISSYKVIVLSSSKYQNLNELENTKIGYLKSDEDSLKEINKLVNIECIEYEDLFELYEDLINNKINSMILDEAYLNVLADEYYDIDKNIRILHSYDVTTKLEKQGNESEKALRPINIYISGSDSYSKTIVNKSRSDVNMIITINPNTNKILLTSIPRDYYVNVYGKHGLKDKLTHSGIYGIDTTTKTVEQLLDIKIDYSIKIGFNAVEEIVDLVGGIDVYSDQTFNSYHIPGWVVKKGTNHFDGKQALAYARERKAYTSGDRHRIQNQQQVLEAVLKKVLADKSLLLKYDKLLNSFKKLYRTDIPSEVITTFVKYQLDTMNDWDIESQWINGKNASLPTYTSPNSKRYVMIPNEEDIIRANKTIKSTLNKK